MKFSVYHSHPNTPMSYSVIIIWLSLYSRDIYCLSCILCPVSCFLYHVSCVLCPLSCVLSVLCPFKCQQHDKKTISVHRSIWTKIIQYNQTVHSDASSVRFHTQQQAASAADSRLPYSFSDWESSMLWFWPRGDWVLKL